jgi:glutathionyl-hydroquinone reductase
MKGLDSVIDLHLLSAWMGERSWFFSGERGSPPRDPLYGFETLRELYLKADPAFEGRVTVPVLWDTKTETIVNNESAEIIRMLYEEFDEFLPEANREANRPGGGFYPEALRKEIDEMNAWVVTDLNIGVYKAGFATEQSAYDAAVPVVFAALDRLEERLASATPAKPFLFGAHVTEADVRLFTTLIRFDVAYYSVFMCNVKMIRHDYPRLYLWMRRLYWDHGGGERAGTKGAFFRTTEPWMDLYTAGYARSRRTKVMNGQGVLIVPRGPDVLVEALREGEELSP